MEFSAEPRVMVDAIFTRESRDPRARFVGTRTKHQWCHMWCNPGDEVALHAMARVIGLKYEWFQDKKGFPHYDLTPSKRRAALEMGATATDLTPWLRRSNASHAFKVASLPCPVNKL